MAAPPGGGSESEKARLFAYMNVVEEVKAGEEAKLRLLLKTKDLEEQLEQQKRDQKDIYFYLNKKCDDAYNMIAKLEEQLSSEQQDRELCEKALEDQVSSLQNLLKNERETSKQTIQKLEDKLVALYSFETMKDKLEAQVAELQRALEGQRVETTRRVDDCELRFAAERRRMERERQAALDELRHEMENSLEARMPKAVQKTLQINQLIRAELQQQSSTAINILDRDSVIQADAKAAKLELSLAQGHEKEMLGKLSTYQLVIKKLNEQMAREKAERDQMSDDFLSAMRAKDAEAALLKAQLDDARVALAGQQESDRHDAAVWRFLCAAYHAHSGPRNFSLPELPGMPGIPETEHATEGFEGRNEQTRRPAQLAGADIWVNNNHSDDGEGDGDGDRDGEQSEFYRALSEESFVPAPALSTASASVSSLEEFYSRPLRQYPLPPSEHWSPAKEKVLVYLVRMLLLRYPHRFASITAEAAIHVHSNNNSSSQRASPIKGRALLPQGPGSFALTQPSFASGGDDASTSSVLSLAKPPASRQSPSSSRGGSRGSQKPSSRSISYESMQSFRSIFVPESFAAEARAVDLVSTMSDSSLSLATLSRTGDDSTATSGSLPDLTTSSASAASRRARAGTFKTTQASARTSSDAHSTGGSSTGSAADNSHAPPSPSRATNFGVSRGSPLKSKPAALDMRNLVSERIMNADAASLEALGWKFGNGFGRSKASDVSAISLTGRSVVAPPEQRSASGAPGSQGRDARVSSGKPVSTPGQEDDDEVSLLSVSPRGLEFIVSESL